MGRVGLALFGPGLAHWKACRLFGRAHSTIAQTCLSFLNSHQVKALSTNPSPDLRDTPFLEYSSLYWGTHAKRELSDCAKQLALKLFDDYNNHISTKILVNAKKSRSLRVNFDGPSRFSGLHSASFFGIVEIVASLVEAEDCDINQVDCIGNAPLVWAALNGHEVVVKILPGRGDVNPDKPDRTDRTPLLCAAKNGHEGVVKMLLRRGDVNPDKPDNIDQTPLLYAATNGHEGVVKILLERDDVSPDEPDWNGRTPLWRAVGSGYEGVVKMLLGRDDVNLNEPYWGGQTPLLYTAKNGREGVVKMLLGRDDVNPDKPDRGGRTPLWWATHRGHAGVIALLQPPTSPTPNTA